MTELIEYMYLIEIFDTSLWTLIRPNPALFKTEEEAKTYCKRYTNKNLLCSYTRLEIGEIMVQQKK